MKPAPIRLYELKIAFGLIPGPGEVIAPYRGWWIALFRHILVDCDRQHASHGVLHRQAVLAGSHRRGGWDFWSCAVLNAAACAHEFDATAAGARADRLVLEGTVYTSADRLGHAPQ